MPTGTTPASIARYRRPHGMSKDRECHHLLIRSYRSDDARDQAIARTLAIPRPSGSWTAGRLS